MHGRKDGSARIVSGLEDDLHSAISPIAAPTRIRFAALWIAAVSSIFAIWVAIFIERSSVVGIDGRRYYSLFDDAMVSMRYAWNFSHGAGLVWNPGGPHVEGYTNLLMTLYMSVLTFFFSKSAAVLFVQVSGTIFLLACAFITMRIAALICADHRPGMWTACRLLAFVWPLTYFPLVFFSLMGMETGLLAVLILGATLSALSVHRPTGLLGVLLGLAFMTRPDALVPCSIILIYTWWINPHEYRRLVIDAFALAACVAGVTLFQVWYYHAAVPNTYTLKMTGMPLGVRLSNGWGFVKPFLTSAWLVLALAFLDLIRKRSAPAVLLGTLVLSSILYQVWTGGDPWPYWRMMAPTMPLAFVLTLDVCAAMAAKLRLRIGTGVLLVGCLSAVTLIIANGTFWPDIRSAVPPSDSEATLQNVDTAIAFDAVTTSTASIAVTWAGTLPYYSGRPAIDMLGMSDTYIARLSPDLSGSIAWSGMTSVPGHNKYDLRYSILHLRPTLTQTLIWGRQNILGQATTYHWYRYKGVDLLLDSSSKLVKWRLLAPQ
jgi:hypothetical protein